MPNFEAALADLESIVHDLEEGSLGLSEALARYENGVRLLKQCYGLLENAERKIELLTGTDAAGNPLVVPLDDQVQTLEQKSASRTRRRPVPEAPRQDQELRPDSDMDGL